MGKGLFAKEKKIADLNDENGKLKEKLSYFEQINQELENEKKKLEN